MEEIFFVIAYFEDVVYLFLVILLKILLLFYLMDIALYIDSVVYRMKMSNKKIMSQFRVNVTDQIIEKIKIPEYYISVDRPIWGHFISKIPSTSKVGMQGDGRCVTAQGKRQFGDATKCMVPLRIENCFELYPSKTNCSKMYM